MKRKWAGKFICAVLLAAFLAGCAGDDGVVGTGVAPKIKIAGAVQKGPFVIGSRVTIGRLLEAGSQSSTDAVITTTSNDLGDFAAEMAQAGSFEIIADGYHFNELTGGLSQGTLLLRAVYFADASSSRKADVNLLTHLIHGRILFLIRAGSTAAVAEAQARAELLAALTPVFRVEKLPEFTSLSLYNVNATSEIGNAYLLAVSATAYQYATTKASGNKTSIDAELTLLINSMADDFTQDGAIKADFIDGLIAASRLLNADTITANLKKRSVQAVGEALSVPDIRMFLDTDDDGETNNLDIDDDNDGVPDSIDPFPYGRDNYQLIVAEGQYRNMSEQTPLTAEFAFQHAIAKVEYFVEGESVGTATTPPYRVDWNPYFWSDIERDLELIIRVTSQFGATYDYRVAASLNRGSFVLHGATPEHRAVLRNTVNLTLTWLAITGATVYEIRVWDVYDNSRLNLSLTTVETAVQLPVFTKSSKYSWLIRAVNAHGNFGNWMPFRPDYSYGYQEMEFEIAGPEAPQLLLPAAESPVLPNMPVEFSWSAMAFATEYQLCVRAYDNNRLVTCTRTAATTLSLNLGAGQYFWAVEAFNKFGLGLAAPYSADTRLLYVGLFRTNLSGFQAHAIHETLDGGFILAGTTAAAASSAGPTSDAVLTKLNGVGATAWQVTLTPVDAYADTAFDVKPTPDGGYLVAGSTTSLNNHTSPDLYLMKTDGAGAQQWLKMYTGACPCTDAEVKLTAFGATVMARTASKSFIVGVDTAGRKLWSKTLLANQIASGGHAATAMEKTLDGGYVLFGDYAGVESSNYPYIVKLGTNGITEWTATTNAGRFMDIKHGFQTLDSGYIVVGTDTLPTTSLLKITAQGTVSWLRSIVLPYDLSSQATFTPATSIPLLEMPDGGYILFSRANDGKGYSMLQRLDSTGLPFNWSSYPYAPWGTPVAVIRSADGGFVMLSNDIDPVTGERTRPVIVKTDRNGLTVLSAYPPCVQTGGHGC